MVLTFTLVSQCAGGGHAVISVSDGVRSMDCAVLTDTLRGALGSNNGTGVNPLTGAHQDLLDIAWPVLRAKAAGLTRAQIRTALLAGVSVTL